MERGRIHLYCGEGKGKTTAAMGLAARTAGQGVPVVIAQFLKAAGSAELNTLTLSPYITVAPGPEKVKFTFAMDDQEKAEAACRNERLFRDAVKLCLEKQASLLVLDEALGAVSKQMLPLEQLLDFLREKPTALEVVLTGREPAPQLLALADYITEMKKIRHPYDKGEQARRGIEY